MRRISFVVGSSLFLLMLSSSAFAQTQNCSDKFMANLRAAATEESGTIKINCHVTLDPKDVITKKIIFEGPAASGVVFDCRGAKIQAKAEGDDITVQSKKVTETTGAITWQRPEDITIKNCEISGSMRIRGMAPNGEGEFLRESSRLDDKHTMRAQANAPRLIMLDNLTIIGAGRIPLYISPGSTYVTLKNSHITGKTTSVAIYMDAESAFNVIQNNRIDADTETRELLAVDASAKNRIIGNYFSSLSNGGIYLYRNCGEGGTVRHQSPQKNQIINNTFFYKTYKGANPAVWLASRNGNRGYCNDDAGFPWGSSVSNKDFARDNVVAENQIYVLDHNKMLRENDSPNRVFANQTVSAHVKRKSSCYSFEEARLLADGASSVKSQGGGREQICHRMLCDDGELKEAGQVACPESKVVDFSCKIANKNGGCAKEVTCPAGFKIQDVKAICDLEQDSVAGNLANVPWGRLKVERSSDNLSDGLCAVQDVKIRQGEADLNIHDLKSVKVHCSDRDKNGGDCEIKGQLRCAP